MVYMWRIAYAKDFTSSTMQYTVSGTLFMLLCISDAPIWKFTDIPITDILVPTGMCSENFGCRVIFTTPSFDTPTRYYYI